MKLAANVENLVWLIVLIVVGISKAIGKLSNKQPTTPADDESPTPPPIQRPRPRYQDIPRPSQVEKRLVQPVAKAPSGDAPPRDFRELLDRLRQPEAVPPKARQESPPPPLPQPVVPKVEEAPATPPVPVATNTSPSRSTQWSVALRDRANIRNIIISAEIIGPPRGG